MSKSLKKSVAPVHILETSTLLSTLNKGLYSFSVEIREIPESGIGVGPHSSMASKVTAQLFSQKSSHQFITAAGKIKHRVSMR